MTIKLTVLLLTVSFLFVGDIIGRYDDVIEHEIFVLQSDLSIQLHPEDPETIHNRAHYLDRSGRYEEALSMIARYKRVAPEHSHALDILFIESQAHSFLGHEKEAFKLRTELYYRERATKKSKR